MISTFIVTLLAVWVGIWTSDKAKAWFDAKKTVIKGKIDQKSE